jgi:outer membrane protein
MKTTIKKTGIALLLIGGLTVAKAQKVAHISMDSLVMLMPETKTMKEVAQNYMKELEKTAISMDNELQTKYNDYLANEATMSDLIKKTKQEEFQSLQKRIEDFKQQAYQDNQRKQGELAQPIYEKAKKAIEAVAKEDGYKYVLDTSQGNVLYTEPTDDILMKVKKKLDGMPLAVIPGAAGSTPAKDNKPAPAKTPAKAGGK